MKIRHLHLPSGLTQGIPFLIEANWTPEQAMAVFELLNDLREQIWGHYEMQLQALCREDRSPHDCGDTPGAELDDESF
jgi:hypothetical protein